MYIILSFAIVAPFSGLCLVIVVVFWIKCFARCARTCYIIFFAHLRGVETPDSNLESGPGSHAKLSVYVGLVWCIVGSGDMMLA